MRRRAWWVGILLGILFAGAPVGSQPFATQIQIAINQLTTGLTTFVRVRLNASSYINWSSGTDAAGYGFRDSAGQIQVKDSGGAWTPIISSSGAPTGASYVTRVTEAGLTNETALASLASALLVNTTGTGVLSAYAGATCTNQFVRVLSLTGVATCNAVSLTLDVTGTLPVANGGLGLTTGTSGGVLYFSGASTLASSAALTANALVLGGGAGIAPVSLGSLGTTTTVLHGNAAGAPTFGGVSLTADVTGILGSTNGGTGSAFFQVAGPATSIKTFTFPNASTTVLTTNAAVTAAQGGTGLASYTIGDLITATGATTLASLADTSTGNALISGGVGVAPLYGKIGLTTHVSGTLAVGSGGTGITTYVTGDLIYASGVASLARLASVAAGAYLQAGGVGAAPVWSTLALPNIVTTGDLLMATATNVVGVRAAVATGQALISQGVATAPIWSASPTLTSLHLAEGTLGALALDFAGDDGIYGIGANRVAIAVDGLPRFVVDGSGTNYQNLMLVPIAYSSGAAGNAADIWLARTSASLLTFWSNVAFTTRGTFSLGQIHLGANLTFSETAPTVSSGFGTTPVITGTTTSFRVNVGTGGTATGGVLTMPTAATGWNCKVDNLTGQAANRADQRSVQTAGATTTVTVQNQTISTGAALAWSASDILSLVCAAY